MKSLCATLVAFAWIELSISELLVDMISPSLSNGQPLLRLSQLLINGWLVHLLCLVLVHLSIVDLDLMLGGPRLPHSELMNLWLMLWLLHIERYMIHSQVLRLRFHSLQVLSLAALRPLFLLDFLFVPEPVHGRASLDEFIPSGGGPSHCFGTALARQI